MAKAKAVKLQGKAVEATYEALAESFIKICELLQTVDERWLAEEAGVSVQTIRNWRNYDVIYPHTRTLFNIAWAMGFIVKLQRRHGYAVKIPKRLKSVK